jgi:predicted DNA-binding transcriptional regulator AlpA
MIERLWTVEDVAAHLKMPLKEARRAVMRGDFPRPVKVTRKLWRWIPDEVRAWVPSPPRPPTVALYKHYDGNGRLLYVGISLSHLYRLADHRDSSGWYADIRTIKIRHYPDRAAAKKAERQAIERLDPQFNKSR